MVLVSIYCPVPSWQLLSGLAIRRRFELYVISVATGPPTWRCSLDTRYSSFFWSLRRQCCYGSTNVDTTTVLYQVGAALWTVAIRHHFELYVVSVATGPPTWTQQLSCTKLALLSEHSLLAIGLLFIVTVTVSDCGLIVSAVLY